LWGEFLPVPEARLRVPDDGQVIVIGNLHFTPVDTPGHAEHHFVYLFENICFSGDIGAVRIPGYPYMRFPMPPPELHLEKWRDSIRRLKREKFDRIAPTHFGVYDDAEWHLNELEKNLDTVLRWLDVVMPTEPSIEELREIYTVWMKEQAAEAGLSDGVIETYLLANPLDMSADGLLRYWKKFRAG
jgi:glyoxylase-like metal-dependent hydrolase (beta-lactamase superfamily II)